MTVSERSIMHIDMNAFFASVEQQANPDLRGKPIAVIGRGRTVVTTSSYEARAFGVKTGMNTWQAKQVCPQIIFVVGDNRKYTHTSAEIMKILQEYTPLVEVFSIDEAWLDITHSLALFGSAETIACQLKARIRHRFGITCSVGIAPNKLLAKLASDQQKPDGLTVFKPADVSRILERMPISELCGIGKKLQRQLNLLSIYTCGDLGRHDEPRLTKKFGVIGKRLKEMGQGIDHAPVVPFGEEEEIKSVGHSCTLARDISDPDEIRRVLLQLSEMVGSRARRYGVSGKTVHLYIRYADFFSSWGKQTTLASYATRTDEIYQAVVAILATVELEQPVRLMGVRLTNLQHHNQQLPLFPEEQKKARMIQAMDAVNNKLGDFCVTYASLLQSKEKGSHVISPAWRPEGIRSVQVQ